MHQELSNALKRTTVENAELSSDAKNRKELEEKRCSEFYLRHGSEKMSAGDKQVLIDAHPKEVKEMISNEGPSGGYFIRPVLWNKINVRQCVPIMQGNSWGRTIKFLFLKIEKTSTERL